MTQIVLYAHLSADAITHVDQHDGPDAPGEVLCGRIEQANQRLLTVEQIRLWCGRPDVQVVVKQVIDLRERLECRGYEPTEKIREHVIVRDGTCMFPWCGRNARRCDLDHIVPYDHDHPEDGGPTSTDNLAALCRRHHRLKTSGRWRYEMTEPGAFVWTSPLGNTYLRDHTGSRAVGRAWPEPGTTTDASRRALDTRPPTRPTSEDPPRTPPEHHRRGHRHVCEQPQGARTAPRTRALLHGVAPYGAPPPPGRARPMCPGTRAPLVTRWPRHPAASPPISAVPTARVAGPGSSHVASRTRKTAEPGPARASWEGPQVCPPPPSRSSLPTRAPQHEEIR